MIVTHAKLAEAMEVASKAFMTGYMGSGDDPRPVNNEAIAGGFRMMSLLLQSLSLKEHNETLRVAWDRMLAKGNQFDLLSEEHRQIMALIIRQMFEPLAVTNLFIIGVTPERKTFIAGISANQTMSIEEMQSILKEAMRADMSDIEEFPI